MNHIVVADPKRCIGCYACVAGCVEGHRKAGLQAYPRLYIIHTPPVGTPPPKLEFNAGQNTYTNTPYQADPMYLREFAIQERLSILNWSIGQKTVAVKCDMCFFPRRGAGLGRTGLQVGSS